MGFEGDDRFLRSIQLGHPCKGGPEEVDIGKTKLVPGGCCTGKGGTGGAVLTAAVGSEREVKRAGGGYRWKGPSGVTAWDGMGLVCSVRVTFLTDACRRWDVEVRTEVRRSALLSMSCLRLHSLDPACVNVIEMERLVAVCARRERNRRGVH